jgi:hypothetical protein
MWHRSKSRRGSLVRKSAAETSVGETWSSIQYSCEVDDGIVMTAKPEARVKTQGNDKMRGEQTSATLLLARGCTPCISDAAPPQR